MKWVGLRTGLALCGGLVLAMGCLGSADAADAPDVDAVGEQVSTAAAPARQAPRHAAGASVEDRVRTLTLTLDLDAEQRAHLTKVLANHSEQVRKAWGDSSVPAAYRVNATRIISDQTADQIRALLTEEQRRKFNPPRQSAGPSTGSASPSVEDWMMAARPKPAAPLDGK